MKLSRVDVVNAVQVNGENKQTLYAPGGAQNIRFDAGLVFFEDNEGLHWVPASNVKSATVAPTAAYPLLARNNIEDNDTPKADRVTKPERATKKR